MKKCIFLFMSRQTTNTALKYSYIFVAPILLLIKLHYVRLLRPVSDRRVMRRIEDKRIGSLQNPVHPRSPWLLHLCLVHETGSLWASHLILHNQTLPIDENYTNGVD